jgi:hypothetical protein
MLKWVTWIIWDNVISSCGFPVHVKIEVIVGFKACYVQEVYVVIFLFLYELQIWEMSLNSHVNVDTFVIFYVT